MYEKICRIDVIVLDFCLRKAIDGKEEQLGFLLDRRRSSRVPAKLICDLDFADDIVLLSSELEQAKQLVLNVEAECRKVGLELNVKKTKSMFFNVQSCSIYTSKGHEIKQSLLENGDQDFKYLGSWCCKDRDIQTRKSLAWKSLNKMEKIWKSNLDTNLKVRLFRATIETILLFGCATWSLTKAEEKALDGTYTKMLRKVKNINWQLHMRNEHLYGKLDKISTVIKHRRLKLAGHTFRDRSSPAHMLVTWQPMHGVKRRGRPANNFLDTILNDTGFENAKELEACMSNRDQWRHHVSRCSGIDRK